MDITKKLSPNSLSDYIAITLATGLFTGYAPIAPGTFGSALTSIFYYSATKLKLFNPYENISILYLLVISTVIFYVGIWSASKGEMFFGCKDPGKVTIDEVVGQLITYLFLPLIPQMIGIKWGFELWTIIGFFLFRFLDIVKPYPVRQLELLGSGLGIMADDMLAGIQGAILMLLCTTVLLKFLN